MIVTTLARPVTPEVAGSSPVAPVPKVPARGDFFIPCVAERTEQPRASRRRATPCGRKSALSPEVVERIRHEHAQGASLAAIARGLNHDDIPTGQGGRRWWPDGAGRSW